MQSDQQEIERKKNMDRITPYEELKVTTMTLVMSLSNAVNIELAFFLLPITRMDLGFVRETVKCKLPHCSIPGSILSMRYCGNIRGLIRSNAKPFKNAVTIDISTSSKNISLKLSTYSIQMCGASSKEDGIEAAYHVMNHLKYAQYLITKIHNNLITAVKTFDWVKTITKGSEIRKPYMETITGRSGNSDNNKTLTLNVTKYNVDNEIIKPVIEIPTDVDAELVSFLLPMCDDFIYYSDFCAKLDYILNAQKLIDEPLEIEHIDEAMVNYNYSLNFEVDRERLNQYIDGKNDFISRYNNALATSVTIELSYEPLTNTGIKRRKNKIPHHTFLVYRSGSVTQSGPGGELMKQAYYLFMCTIMELKPFIQYGANKTLLYNRALAN